MGILGAMFSFHNSLLYQLMQIIVEYDSIID